MSHVIYIRIDHTIYNFYTFTNDNIYSRASVELKYNCTTNSFSQSRILFKDTLPYTIMENNNLEVIKNKCIHKKRIHNKRKSECVECKGSQICEHNKRRYICVECDGNGICEHKKRKSISIECNGSQICEHDKIKSRCVDWKGSEICEHDKLC